MNLDTCIDFIESSLAYSPRSEFIIENFSVLQLQVVILKVAKFAPAGTPLSFFYYVRIISNICEEEENFFPFYSNNFDSLAEAIFTIYNLLDQDKKIKYFSKLTSQLFTTKEDLLKAEMKTKVECFLTQEEIEKCPVCFEDTLMTTNCNHPICWDCLTKVSHCPLCRAVLFKNLDEDGNEIEDVNIES